MGGIETVSIRDHFENIKDEMIASGRFTNTSEVVVAGLQLLE